MIGGYSDAGPADEDVDAVLRSVRHAAEAEAKRDLSPFRAVSSRRQVVAGTNFLINVDVGKGEYAHLTVFRPLPHTNEPPQLKGMELCKAEGDHL
ncbi:unnamed protein product [Phaeothamnion confervicola]